MRDPDERRRPAVFFDRDGVLNVDYGYEGEVERFQWTSTAIEAVKYVNDLGYFAFAVTNQSGVARGFYDEAAVAGVHDHMRRELRRHGAHLDDERRNPNALASLLLRCSHQRRCLIRSSQNHCLIRRCLCDEHGVPTRIVGQVRHQALQTAQHLRRPQVACV